MDTVLGPELEEQYRNALKTIRRELRQSGHTIDARVHSRHQPRTLIAQVANHFVADDWDNAPDDKLDLGESFGQPDPEVIEAYGKIPQEERPPAPTTRIIDDFVPREHHLEEPLLATNPKRDLLEVFQDLSTHANANPLLTTILVAEPLEEDDLDQELDQDPCVDFDANLAEACTRWFKEALKAIGGKSRISSIERLRLVVEALASETTPSPPSRPRRHLQRLSPPLLESPTTPERIQAPRRYPFEDHPFSSPESLLAIDISEVQKRLSILDGIESQHASPSKAVRQHLNFNLPEARQRPRFELESPLVLREKPSPGPVLATAWPCLDISPEDPFVNTLDGPPPALFPGESVTELIMEDECLQQSLNIASARVQGRLREELDPVDPSIRLKLPHVEPFDMIPEWMTCLGPREVRRHLRKAMGRAYKVKPVGDPDMRLRWNPLPAGYTRPEPECISLQRRKPPPLIALATHPTSHHLLQAQGAPKILAHDYVDDMLPPISYTTSTPVAISPYFSNQPKETVSFLSPSPIHPSPPKDDLTVLIRKRRADSQLVNPNPARRLSYLKPHNPLTPPRGALLMDGEDQNPVRRLLQNLMHMRAPEKITAQLQSSLPTPLESTKQGGTAPKKADVGAMISCTPDFEAPSTPHRVVVSTTLSRAFISFLRGWLPGIVLIDRDLSTDGLKSQSAEADIIPSPTVGIILTTMLKVRQAPMPGSGGLSHLRERIMRVAPLYEQLIVLVSEDNPTSEAANAMSKSDKSVLRDFVSFSLAIRDVHVRVTHVGGGPKLHALRAASNICRFAASERLQKCLHVDEKPLEVFLRRKGMNAYASQVLESHLEDIHGEGALRQFLVASMEEKLRISCDVFGSDAMMRRVAIALS